LAHATRPINLIEIVHRGEIRGSVIPGVEVTMRFYFILGLVLVTSDCGITAERSVDKLVNTSAAHIWAFCDTKSLSKNAKCDTYALFFVAQTVTIGEQKISPKSHILKNNIFRLLLLQTKVLPTTGLAVVLVENMLE